MGPTGCGTATRMCDLKQSIQQLVSTIIIYDIPLKSSIAGLIDEHTNNFDLWVKFPPPYFLSMLHCYVLFGQKKEGYGSAEEI